MIDFSDLPRDGVAFEQLCRELLIRYNFEVHWTGVGADGGRDLIVIEKADGALASFERKWLVSCKHFAASRKSVGVSDVVNIVDDCSAVNANGYLLICSTQLSSALIQRFDEIKRNNSIVTSYWDSIEILKRLNTPEAIPLIKLFFPDNKQNVEWKIYNALTPSLWAANYKGYFFYMESRTDCKYPCLDDVEVIIDKIMHAQLPPPIINEFECNEIHCIRPRYIFFDNKADDYSVSCDYVYPVGQDPLNENEVKAQLGNGEGLYKDSNGESKLAFWTVNYVAENQISDHYNPDHKDYYLKYISKFSR